MNAPVRHVRSLAEVRARHPDLRVVAPASTKADLLAAIYRALDAPSYAGANYDALSDVVGDLGWLAPGRIRLGWTPSVTLPAGVRAEVVSILADAAAESERTSRALIVYVAVDA